MAWWFQPRRRVFDGVPAAIDCPSAIVERWPGAPLLFDSAASAPAAMPGRLQLGASAVLIGRPAIRACASAGYALGGIMDPPAARRTGSDHGALRQSNPR